MREQGLPARYEITLDGVLDDRWTAWFGDISITTRGGRTVLSAVISDQAALHGLLGKVRDLGLPLISLCRRRGRDDPKGHGAS
jgi:hypothetical protein